MRNEQALCIPYMGAIIEAYNMMKKERQMKKKNKSPKKTDFFICLSFFLLHHHHSILTSYSYFIRSIIGEVDDQLHILIVARQDYMYNIYIYTLRKKIGIFRDSANGVYIKWTEFVIMPQVIMDAKLLC